MFYIHQLFHLLMPLASPAALGTTLVAAEVTPFIIPAVIFIETPAVIKVITAFSTSVKVLITLISAWWLADYVDADTSLAQAIILQIDGDVIRRRVRIALRYHHIDGVLPRGQAREIKITVMVGDQCRDQRSVRRMQLHRQALNAALIELVDTVLIGIVIDDTFNGAIADRLGGGRGHGHDA